jgi:nitrite reductase (NADH) small subunit
MTEYLIGKVDELPERGHRVVQCGETEIGVFRFGGELHAWHNSCAHRQGPICQGRLYNRVIEPLAADGTVRMLAHDPDRLHIVCPWHGYEFDVKTGENPGTPSLRLRRVELRTEGELLYALL